MNKLAFVLLYFGNLNRSGYWRLFLASLAANPTIDLLLFTDDRAEYPYPPNMRVEYTTLDAMRARISDVLGFDACIPSAYKLCDFKVTYGEVFAEELSGYDFWGYIDCDMILGDLRRVLTDELLARHDKVYTLGHMTLFRNTPEITGLYRQALASGYNTDYRRAMTSPDIYAIDEWGRDGGVNQIFRLNQLPMYDGYEFDDISTLRTGFRPEHKRHNPPYHKMIRTLYAFRDGKLLRHSESYGALVSEEVLYIHLQKRAMENRVTEPSTFLIEPNRFVDFEPVTLARVQSLPPDRFDWSYLRIYAKRVKNRLKRG